jgi:hypothetical protein
MLTRFRGGFEHVFTDCNLHKAMYKQKSKYRTFHEQSPDSELDFKLAPRLAYCQRIKC